MSIVVCCNLPDGIILGADSAVTVTGQLRDETAGATRPGVLKVFERAQKLFALCDDSACGEGAVATVGVGLLGVSLLGGRTVGSHLEEFNDTESAMALAEAGRTSRQEGNLGPVCHRMWSFFAPRYEQALAQEFGDRRVENVPAPEKPPLGFLVAGYAGGQVLGEGWLVDLRFPPEEGGVTLQRAKGAFGANWGGVSGPLSRFIKGYDMERLPDGLRHLLTERFGGRATEEVWPDVRNLLGSLEYLIPYPAMPIEEGIEHVRYLVGLAISFARYAAGPPVCGGDIRLALITRKRGFRWVGHEPI